MPPDPAAPQPSAADKPQAPPAPPPPPAPSHVPAKVIPAEGGKDGTARPAKTAPITSKETAVTRVVTAPTLCGNRQTVLVCDDVMQIRKILCFNLKSANYETIEAEDGEAALKVLEDQKVDAVLLDVMTPKVDGFTACARIKANARTKHLPVIMLTACSQKEDIIRALSTGACDYIVKPFKKETVLAKLKKALTGAAASPGADALAAPPPAPPAAAPPPPPASPARS